MSLIAKPELQPPSFLFSSCLYLHLYMRMTCWALRLARGLLLLLSECWEVLASTLEFQMQVGKSFLPMCSLDLKLHS